MILLNEILLDVLHFLDYSSVLRSKFACSNFHRAITRNQDILASPQKMSLFVKRTDVRVEKAPFALDLSASEWRNFGSVDAPLAPSIYTAALNPIAVVHIWCNAVTTGVLDKVLSALPAANYASHLCICHTDDVRLTNAQLVALVERFRELKSITLEDIPKGFDWTILRNSCWMRLRDVYLDRYHQDFRAVFINEAAEAEIIRFAGDFSLHEPSQPKLMTADWMCSVPFTMKIIQVRAKTLPACIPYTLLKHVS